MAIPENLLHKPAGSYFMFIRREWERMFLWIEMHNLGWLFYPESTTPECSREEAIIRWTHVGLLQSVKINEDVVQTMHETFIQHAIQFGVWKIRLAEQAVNPTTELRHDQLNALFGLVPYRALARMILQAPAISRIDGRDRKHLDSLIYEMVSDIADC